MKRRIVHPKASEYEGQTVRVLGHEFIVEGVALDGSLILEGESDPGFKAGQVVSIFDNEYRIWGSGGGKMVLEEP